MAYNREKIQAELFELQDEKYRDFHSKLIPDMEKENIIGIRTPVLRKYAKQFAKTEDAAAFLQDIPHTYYEENNLHGLLLEQMKDYEGYIEKVKQFLPFIDNWATCDMFGAKVAKKHLDIFIKEVYEFIDSDNTYTIRFGISMLMKHYLEFKLEYPQKVAEVSSNEYYVNMMRAWYFATALAKQYDSIIPFIEEKRLDVWTHNKAIQKSIESYRITPEQKGYLRTLKIR